MTPMLEVHSPRMFAAASRSASWADTLPSVAISKTVPTALKKRPHLWNVWHNPAMIDRNLQLAQKDIILARVAYPNA
jgi:hypothetical protein